MHEVLVNRLGGLSLPRKSVVRLTDRPDMTLDVYRGRKTTNQQQQHIFVEKNMVGWMDDLRFYVISTLFQLYQDDERLIMKDCTMDPCLHLRRFCLKQSSNLGPLDR